MNNRIPQPTNGYSYTLHDRQQYEVARQKLYQLNYRFAKIYNVDDNKQSLQHKLQALGKHSIITQEEHIQQLRLTQELQTLLCKYIPYKYKTGGFVQTFIGDLTPTSEGPKKRLCIDPRNQESRSGLDIDYPATEGRWLYQIGYIARTHHRMYTYDPHTTHENILEAYYSTLPQKLRTKYKLKETLTATTANIQLTAEEAAPDIGKSPKNLLYRFILLQTTEPSIQAHIQSLTDSRKPTLRTDNVNITLHIYSRKQIQQAVPHINRAYEEYLELKDHNEQGRKIVILGLHETTTTAEIQEALAQHCAHPIQEIQIPMSKGQPIGFVLLQTEDEATIVVDEKEEVIPKLRAQPGQTIYIAKARRTSKRPSSQGNKHWRVEPTMTVSTDLLSPTSTQTISKVHQEPFNATQIEEFITQISTRVTTEALSQALQPIRNHMNEQKAINQDLQTQLQETRETSAGLHNKLDTLIDANKKTEDRWEEIRTLLFRRESVMDTAMQDSHEQ